MKIVPEPRLGLFWFVPEDGRLVMKGAARPSSEVPLIGGFRTVEIGHISVWKAICIETPALREYGYEYFPRGRVHWIEDGDEYLLLADPVIIERGLTARVIEAWELPPDRSRAIRSAEGGSAAGFGAAGHLPDRCLPKFTGFELPDRRAVAWSNISKVQLLDPVGNSASINNLNPAERKEVIRWQTALARAEIAYGQPDVIIMFTGRLSWVAKCMFANDSVDQVEAVIERQLLSLPWSTRELVAPGLAGIVTAQTYHPAVWQNLRPKANAERTVMLQWAKQRTAA
jgi:hypothetical protein